VMHLISVVLSRPLLMVASALVSISWVITGLTQVLHILVSLLKLILVVLVSPYYIA